MGVLQGLQYNCYFVQEQIFCLFLLSIQQIFISKQSTHKFLYKYCSLWDVQIVAEFCTMAFSPSNNTEMFIHTMCGPHWIQHRLLQGGRVLPCNKIIYNLRLMSPYQVPTMTLSNVQMLIHPANLNHSARWISLLNTLYRIYKEA